MTHSRRGNCLFMTLVGLAVIGGLVLIGGLGLFVANGPTTAASDLKTQVTEMFAHATPLEAPGTFDVELKKGGAAFFLSPDGKVGEKVIPIPPASVSYTVAVKDPEGNAVQFDPNTSPRTGSEPFYLLGFCKTDKDGKYSISLSASDSTTHAAIVVAPATSEEFEGVMKKVGAIALGFGGACGAICGLAMLLVFGLIAFFVRRKARPDPLAV
jgi:hypothetical protein